MQLELTRKEVESIINYVFAHVRATEGLAKQTYERMREFLDSDEPLPLFDETKTTERI